MTKEEIEKLVQMNQVMAYVLGVAAVIISGCQKFLSEDQKKHYDWLMTSLDCIFYADKPIPPMP